MENSARCTTLLFMCGRLTDNSLHLLCMKITDERFSLISGERSHQTREHSSGSAVFSDDDDVAVGFLWRGEKVARTENMGGKDLTIARYYREAIIGP